MAAKSADGGGLQTVGLKERDEIVPEDVRHLDWIELHPILILELLEVVDQGAYRFLVVRMQLGFGLGADPDHLNERAIL